MADPIDPLELGERLGALAAQNDAILRRLDTLESEVRALRATAAYGRGALAVVLGFGAVVGSFAEQVLGRLFK